MPSILEQYPISDFAEWNQKKTLILNPHFQRRNIWTPAARSYLIDTILRRMPVPKIYLRTKIQPKNKQTLREVVDGQQRLRAILDFVDGRLKLGKQAAEFKGKTFIQLEDDLQVAFLEYRLAVDQLVNATDSDVLDMFGRLNSYNLVLTPAERRHAKYQGDFKWAVYESARQWKRLWDDFKVLGVRQRLRMADDSMMAELYGVLLDGVNDGDERAIGRLYTKYDKSFDDTKEEKTQQRLKATLDRLLDDVGEAIEGPLASRPHFVMLFAAVAHKVVGIPHGAVGTMPNRSAPALKDPAQVVANLVQLADVIDSDDPPESDKARAFWTASRRATVRAASRRIRFLVFWESLLPDPVQL